MREVNAGARLVRLKSKTMVAVWSGPRRMLVEPRQADMILADLQVLYHERMLHDDSEVTDG